MFAGVGGGVHVGDVVVVLDVTVVWVVAAVAGVGVSWVGLLLVPWTVGRGVGGIESPFWMGLGEPRKSCV